MTQKYAVNLAANSLTDLTGGGAAAGTYLLNIVNRAEEQTAIVRVAITTGAAPVAADWIEHGAQIEPAGVLSRWPLPLAANWRVYVHSSAGDVSAVLIGEQKEA